ncbi:hypothetical protein N8K70_08385 [Microbacterium betulae]|uniref:Uncharacterized protein n=1 Tax=Microbacterium betulae TaxID=2981139 RepID=A0AA97FKM2_9MICO|nr:hypothetical protein [Microbacterium sp. AB]WOF24656.1 hypothetical protein N8K70_08385 [Microbacterium sp. AB]
MTAIDASRRPPEASALRRATWPDLPLLVRLTLQDALRRHPGVRRPFLLGVAAVAAVGVLAGALGAPAAGLAALWAVATTSSVIAAVVLLVAGDVARRLVSRNRDIVLSSRRDASVDIRRPAEDLLVFSHHVALDRGAGEGRALREMLSAAVGTTAVAARMIVPSVEFAAVVMGEFPNLVLRDAGGVLELSAPGGTPSDAGKG